MTNFDDDDMWKVYILNGDDDEDDDKRKRKFISLGKPEYVMVNEL